MSVDVINSLHSGSSMCCSRTCPVSWGAERTMSARRSTDVCTCPINRGSSCLERMLIWQRMWDRDIYTSLVLLTFGLLSLSLLLFLPTSSSLFLSLPVSFSLLLSSSLSLSPSLSTSLWSYQGWEGLSHHDGVCLWDTCNGREHAPNRVSKCVVWKWDTSAWRHYA